MSKKLIKIITSDEKQREVEVDLLKPCKFFTEEKLNERDIPIEVRSEIFDLVIEHLNLYKKYNKLTIQEPLPDNLPFEKIVNNKEIFDYIEKQDFEHIFELINAGALLEYDQLHDLACAKIAHFMKGKTPEEVNNHFTIECQLTNEEAKELGLDVDIDG